MSKLIYLASPYSHQNKDVEISRYLEISTIAANLMKNGFVIFSPIVHCHPIAIFHSLPTDFKYWENYLKVFIRKSDEVIVAMMDGWRKSKGVQEEIRLAIEIGVPASYLTWDGERYTIKMVPE